MYTLHQGGVASEHAVHVGPDLDFFSAYARADNGGSEVRPAAAQGGGHAVQAGADVSGQDDNAVVSQRGNCSRQPGISLAIQRRGLGVALVGDDHTARIQVRAAKPQIAERERNDKAREPLSIAGNGVARARRQLTAGGQLFDQSRQFAKMWLDDAVQLFAVGGRNHRPALPAVVLPQLAELLERLLLAAPGRLGANGEQPVRSLPHRRDHHHRPAVQPGAYDRRHAFDGRRRLQRRAAELHDDHQSRNPSEYISSALSTAAPAAPRMALWPSATYL